MPYVLSFLRCLAKRTCRGCGIFFLRTGYHSLFLPTLDRPPSSFYLLLKLPLKVRKLIDGMRTLGLNVGTLLKGNVGCGVGFQGRPRIQSKARESETEQVGSAGNELSSVS